MGTDEQIKKEIMDAFCKEERLVASSIIVSVKNGVVELAGAVSSKQERDAGERVAKSIPKVGKVQNHIAIVKEPPNDPKTHIA